MQAATKEKAHAPLPSVPENQEAQPGVQAEATQAAADAQAGPSSSNARPHPLTQGCASLCLFMSISCRSNCDKYCLLKRAEYYTCRSAGEASGSGAALEEPSAVTAVGQLPEHLLRQLPELLGQAGLSEVAYTRAGAVIQLVVDVGPHHRRMLLAELDAQLQRWASLSQVNSSSIGS